jgi:hypothetical protein
MALRLFEHPLSPYARKVKIVLEEKGIPYQRIFVNPLDPDLVVQREFLPVVRQYRDHRLEWMMKSGGVDVVLRGLERKTIRFQAEFE